MADAQVLIDVSLIQDIESVLAIDTADPPGVIAPLYAEFSADPRSARADAIWHEQHHDWLRVTEVHAVRQLRGWHRQRFGRVSVEHRWLRDVAWLLGNLITEGGRDCAEMLAESKGCGDHAEMQARFDATGKCGECEECQWRDCENRCYEALNAGDGA